MDEGNIYITQDLLLHPTTLILNPTKMVKNLCKTAESNTWKHRVQHMVHDKVGQREKGKKRALLGGGGIVVGVEQKAASYNACATFKGFSI